MVVVTLLLLTVGVGPYFSLTHSFGGEPLHENSLLRNLASINWKRFLSPSHGAEYISISWTLYAWLTSMTDRQTDGRTEWPLAIARS